MPDCARVALAAMGHRFGQVGAAIPLRVAVGIGLVALVGLKNTDHRLMRAR